MVKSAHCIYVGCHEPGTHHMHVGGTLIPLCAQHAKTAGGQTFAVAPILRVPATVDGNRGGRPCSST